MLSVPRQDRSGRTGVRRRPRRGVAAVEFAMVAPLLCLFFVGISEVSRGIEAKVTLSNAVRKGCRTGIQRDKGNADIFADVVNIMRDNGYDSTKFNPAAPDGLPGPGDIGSVTINVTDPSGNFLKDSLGAPPDSQ